MPYVDATHFAGEQGYITQVDITDPDQAAIVEAVLARAESAVDNYLGFSFDGYANATRTIRAPQGPFWQIPAHDLGSVTAVLAEDGTDLAGYWEETSTGALFSLAGLWGFAKYQITADWGYGDPPESVKEVVLEVAVNIWQSRSAGRFSSVVGSRDGGAVGYERAFTNFQAQILDDLKAKYTGVAI